MSDDTTTWLKKNPAVNPLRRSLKTSLRFNVPSSEMNTSIMSNPDEVKDQGLFIPRMLQRSNLQMRKSRVHEFKVPEMVVPKPSVKKEHLGSGAKYKKIASPSRARKSLLPIPRATVPSAGKGSVKANNIPRPSFVPGGSGRRTAKRELIKKVVELTEIKRKDEEAERQVNIISGDSSVLRSILKKRASLRRSSQISAKKPKVKKVLFDGFENSDGEKENATDMSLQSGNDFNAALDELTTFLNIPNGANMNESLLEPASQQLNWTVEESKDTRDSDITNIIKLWESYKENLESIQMERSSVEQSLESLLQHNLNFQKQYQSYKENSEEIYCRLAKLGKEIEENLKRAVGGDNLVESETPKAKRRSSGRRVSDKEEKIKMSDKSKAIKRISGRKLAPLLKRELFNDSIGSSKKF